jgi:hypothetical protein
MLAAGIEYKNDLSNLTGLATITDNNFSNRNPITTPGLANLFVQHDVSLTYARTIDPNLTVTGQFGLTGRLIPLTRGQLYVVSEAGRA